MSHLIQLRQRIKVIETLSKTTNAMRLISMSTHTRLRNKKSFLTDYRLHIDAILQSQSYQSVSNSCEHPAKKLIIALGAHKGLCGTFNTTLTHYVKEHIKKENDHTLIAVGNHLAQRLETEEIIIHDRILNLSSATFLQKAEELFNLIYTQNYTTVIIYSNTPISFFSHTIITTLLTPCRPQSANNVIEKLSIIKLKTTLLEILFDSLLAEQAARFLAMDGATRNAEELLSEMKLNYNKLRQAIITRELTDLAGGTL